MRRTNRYGLFAVSAISLLLLVVCANFFGTFEAGAKENYADISSIAAAQLPAEALTTLQLIKQGGPYPYRKDGSTFGNRERRLPRQQHGYYKEYTVKTPGAGNRGARRIIAGTVGEYYYTADHYNKFQRIVE